MVEEAIVVVFLIRLWPRGFFLVFVIREIRDAVRRIPGSIKSSLGASRVIVTGVATTLLCTVTGTCAAFRQHIYCI